MNNKQNVKPKLNKLSVLIICLMLMQVTAYSQRSKSYYVNHEGKKCFKSEAAFKRKFINEDTCWLVKDFYKNGNLGMQGRYLEKSMETPLDTIRYYFINGQLFQEYAYQNSLKHGKYKRYYITGELEVLGNYKNGNPTDQWYWYDSNGHEEFHLKDMNERLLQVVKTPVYYSGESDIVESIMSRIEYPSQAVQNELYGVTLALIKVNEKGRITDVDMIIHGTNTMDELITRSIKKIDNLKPATEFGEPVTEFIDFSVSFILDYDEREFSNDLKAKGFFASANQDYKVGKFENAEYKYKQAVYFDNVNAKYYYHLGVTLYNLNKKSEAIAYFKIAHMLDDKILPDNIKSLCNIE